MRETPDSQSFVLLAFVFGKSEGTARPSPDLARSAKEERSNAASLLLCSVLASLGLGSVARPCLASAASKVVEEPVTSTGGRGATGKEEEDVLQDAIQWVLGEVLALQ